MKPPECRIWKANEVSMLRKYVLHIRLLACAIAGAAYVADAQDVKAPASSPSQQGTRPSADGTGERGQSPQLQHRNRRYQLHSADVLELNFPFTPEFNQTVTVQPDGYITLRGVESIKVDGKTIPELVDSLRTSYAKILHDPVINVELKDFEKPYFIVGGEVGHPGKFDLRGNTSVAQAAAIAAASSNSAKHSRIWLFNRKLASCLQMNQGTL